MSLGKAFGILGFLSLWICQTSSVVPQQTVFSKQSDNSIIDINNVVQVDAPTAELQHLTVCMWLEFQDDGRTVGLISCLFGDLYEMEIRYANEGRWVRLRIEDEEQLKQVTPALGLSKWRHLCFARSTSQDEYYVYVSGVLQASGGPLKRNAKVGKAGAKFYLGQAWNATERRFVPELSYEGKMNDVNIWNTMLSDFQIYQLYQTCGLTVGNAVTWSMLLSAAQSSSKSDSKCPRRRGKNCQDFLHLGRKMDRLSYITDNPIRDLPVYCSGINSGGWMNAMIRTDSGVSFDRLFQEYRDGFGSCIDNANAGDTWLDDDCTSDFWLGNRNFFLLTDKNGPFQLLVSLEDADGNVAHAYYKRFAVKSKIIWRYELYIQGYAGTSGDFFQALHGMKFTTKDEDNDLEFLQNCATPGRGGWWYNTCGGSPLNMRIMIPKSFSEIIWNTWPGTGNAVTKTRMMIKPNLERQWDYTLHFQDNGFTTYVGPLKISDFVEATVCWWMIPRGVPMAVYSVSNEQYNNAFTFVQTNILAMKLNVNGRISSQVFTRNLSSDQLWHHVCATWRSTGGRWSIHVDGSKVAERYGLAVGEKIISGTMYIGQFQTSDGTFNNRAFFGYLSHFNMWNMELSENKIKKMSLGCGAEIGNLIQWPDLKAWTKKVSMEEPASCKTREKHRVDFSSFSSDNKFPELLSTREATVEGDGADANMNVLSIQGNSKIKFATTRDDCLNDPSVCSGGFTVSFWLKHEPKFISQILGGNSALHEALNSWLLNVTPIASRWTRCYLTTDHGWWASTFHTNCDNRGPTVTLVKVGDYIFGGFLDQPWGGERNLTSSTAFLFSLQNPEYLQPVKLEINASSINRGAIAALSDLLLGPVFGDGDLVISDMANTGIFSYSKLGRTYLLPDGIDPNTAAAHNLLAGSANFIPDEIEVFAYEVPHYLVNTSIADDQNNVAGGSEIESENFWLQVDIGQVGSVGFVSTKSGLAFPISYHLAYSVDNSTWYDYQENGSRKLFHGNWEGATVVKNAILSPFEARFVRFILNECSEDDCLLEAEAYLLIKESRTNIISLSSENSSSTGLAMFKMQDSLTYRVQVRTMEGLVWSLSFDMSQESHDWTHLTISWHEMWGLKVFINGEVAKKNNMPEEILNDTLIVSTHIEIGGVTSEIYNASSLGTNLQMSDLRIWERLVSRKEARTNYEVSMNVSSGLWYVIKKATFKTEGAVQTSRWILRASCTLSSHTGPCDDGSPREFPPLCNTPLGLESGLVSDSQITSSSVRGPGFENHNARLNYLSCWSTLELDPWIQVELRAFTRVTKVSTQGRPDADEWVQSYAIKYQVTKISPLLDYESEGDFQGNFDRSTIVAHDILATGMIFRIYPKSWYTQPSLRLELYGCSLDEHSFRHIESSYPRERGDKARMLTLHATESHKCLSFTYHMNGSTIGRLNVFIRGPDSGESLLWRLAGSQGNKWNTATVPIERKSPYQIVFEGVVGDSYTGDIAVDNISLGLDNSCTFKPVTARREIAGFRSDLLQNGPWFQDTLMEWLAEKGLGDEYWVPCFRGSLDSWNASLFKSQCRNKKSTVALIRKGDCLFGGFSDKPWEGPVTGFIPSTKSFLFTLQSSSSLSSEAKWPVLSSQRSRAIFYAPGRLQFGEDLVLNLTNRSLSVNIGHVYDIENEDGDLFCGANGTKVEADDVEVLSPLDTLCDVPCVRGQHCDEICGKCLCDATKRDVQRCYERAGLQTDRDESCEPVRYARFDFDEQLTSKQWRCYRPSGLTRDKARYNGESGVYNTVHGAMLQIREDNYPSLVLEDEVLRAEYYFPMDNPDHVHSSKDTILSWSTSFNGKTMGVKDNAVFTNGKTNATLLFNSLGCISDPKLCAEGLTLSLWMKHTNRYGGQTFLSTGGSDIDATNLTRGFRIFQLNGSFDHIAVDMRNEFKRCRWVFTAPQNIWSHLVIKFYSILSGDCVTLKFFLNRDLQVPLFSEERKENYTFIGPMVLIGDLSTGSPTATFDEFAIWYEKISDGYIHRFFDYYKTTQYNVNLTLEREITDDKGASFYTDLEKMEAASFSLIQEVKTLSSADNINTVTLRKYGYRQQSVSSTLSAFVTVVYNDSSGQVPDLLNLGTTLSPTWTLVDKQSSEVDLQGINIFASNKSNVASVNVTVSPSAAQLNLAGIFHGYIIFYKEIDEVNYQSQRVISAEMSFLIPGLKHWTLYDIYARLVTLNGVGKRSNELVVWTRPVAPENVTVYSIKRGLHVHWENINSSEIHQYRVLVTAVYYTSNNATYNETVVSGLDHSLVCENVNIFINYSVTVRAEGNIVGAYSEPVYFMIEAEVPENISACAISSVEVHVSWDPVPVPQLTGYMVQYRKVDNNITSQNVTVYDASRSSVVLHGLLPASNYSILVLLVFADRLKNLSNEVFVATKEPLTVYPAGFQATGTSPTSIFLQWNATEFRDLVGYVIYYNLSDINSTGIQNRAETYIGACNTSLEIFNLKPLTNYSLQIAGFTGYEIGPVSPLITVQTQRQPLEEPPPSIELSPWSLSAIQVSWSPLSFELLRGYVIFYKPMESPGRRKRSAPPLAELNETITSLNTSRRFLTGLNEFTNYSVQAAGFTDFEVGPRTITVYIITNQTVPVVPPRGIKVTSVDSTTLQVCWERIPHFPSLEEYEVHYTPFGQGNASVLSTRANITVATLTGLDPSLTYSVRVAGKTAEGLGPLSSLIAIQTSNFSISKLTAFTRGNSSIIVCLPRQQTVSASSVVYHEVNVAPNLAQRMNVSDFSRKYLMIQNLSTHVNYSVELEFALTCGQIRKSEPTYVVTGKKGPLAAPRRVKANMTDYSSARVKWSPNPSPLVLEYVIQFAPLDASISVITVRVNSTETMVEIDGLTSSTNYSVQLHTVTLCKNGSWSKAVYVASEEGVPNLPPQDLVAENHTSLSIIPVSWRPIPPQNICGVLLEYRVRYTPISLVDGTELDGTPKEKVLPAGNLSTTLENLNRYTVYKIEVWGATRKGEGPSATIFAETCYCHKRLTTNWMFFPPYVDHVIDNSTSSLPIGGIIPAIVVDMVSACCGYCKSHGESYVDYSSYTSQETLQNKKTYNDMVENISQEIDFSFPVFGFEGKLNYKNDYRFIDLIQSPGIAHIVNTKVDNSKEYSLFAAVIGLWPVMAITMVSVLLSGIVIWYLEREENTEQFKSSFIRGTGEGVWWSYISATTVGYGDRAPVTGYGRLFSVFWILMGLVIIGILNGSITTALTSFTIDLNFDIYGKKVAAVQQSPEFRFGIRKNAKMDNVSYKTFREVFSALESGKVIHALFDTYAIGSERALFDKARHLYIYKIYDYSSTYGIVFGGDSAVLQKCFDLFKRGNIADIFKNIKENIDSIETGKPLVLEMSTGLFEVSSPLFKNIVFYCGFCMAVAVVLGLIWEILYRCKGNNKIRNNGGLEHVREQMNDVSRLREMVEDLQQRMRQTYTDLKAKHTKELLLLKETKNEKQNSRDHMGNQEWKNEQRDHFPTGNLMRIGQFKSGSKAETYAHNSNNSVEEYFDNLK